MPVPATSSETLDLEARVAQFEAAWVRGERPELARFVPDANEQHHQEVLRELVLIDREFRLKAQVPLPDYGAMFPDLDPSASAPVVPRKLGRYEVGSLLGRGSFGAVFRGWDPELQRAVAIKVPRAAAFVTDEETERFLREARCSAGLQHPNIVALYDIGRSGDSLYLVSELVEGEPLSKRIVRGGLGTRYSAELIATLANAVHVAHQQQIVHRDLKPGNILMHGDLPKIADFGLAKRIEGSATLTDAGQLIGTPAYMSPEQAKGNTVDARADIYGLGVILFECLTGELPFRGDARMVLRQVVEDDPPSPRRLSDSVPRDLETICLTCLQKEPARRYATAADLAADLQSWLDSRPIQARPIGRLGKLVRWARREPRVAGLLFGLLFTLTTGLSTAIGLYLHARAQSREAEARRREADENFRDAMAVVDEYLTTISQSKLLDRPGMHPLRKELVSAALERYRQFLEKRADDPMLQAEVARGWFRVAYLTYFVGPEREAFDAADNARRAQELLLQREPDNLDLLAELGTSLHFQGSLHGRFGETDQALARYTSAQHIQERLVRDRPEQTSHRVELASTLRAIGRLHSDLGDPIDSLPWADAVEEALRHVDDPAGNDVLGVCRFERGMALRATGRLNEALRAMESAASAFERPSRLSTPPRHMQFVTALPVIERRRWKGNVDNAMGLILFGLGKTSEAEAHFLRSREVRQALADENPQVPSYRAELASVKMNESGAVEASGRLAEAIPARLDSARMYRQLLIDSPELVHLIDTTAFVHLTAAELLVRHQRPNDAVDLLDAYIATMEKLPSSIDRVSVGQALARSAELCAAAEASGRRAKAGKIFAETRPALLQKLQAFRPDDFGPARRDRAAVLESLSIIDRWNGEPKQAIEWCRMRIALLDRSPREQSRAALSMAIAARVANQPKAESEAVDVLRRAIDGGMEDIGLIRAELNRVPFDIPAIRKLVER